MDTIILDQQNSIMNNFIAELRDVEIQKDPLRFRENIERIGQIMAYEISKTLAYEEQKTTTPLGVDSTFQMKEDLVLATILRAGIPLHQGILKVFDRAGSAFVSAYRKYTEKGRMEIDVEYISSPSIADKTIIVSDPMLASGASLELAFKAMCEKGTPKHVHFACIIASEDGVKHIQECFKDMPGTLWVGSVDPELNEKAYIIPGLGDAGDLAYGMKI